MAKKIEMSEVMKRALENFLSVLGTKMVEHSKKSTPNLDPPSLEPDEGLRFVRVWCRGPGSSSRHAYCFIDKSTGEIFKPATWKAPAKHARGSILGTDEQILEACGPYGVVYLNGPSMGW